MKTMDSPDSDTQSSAPVPVDVRLRVRGDVIAGYALFATLIVWNLTPYAPVWPETLVSLPIMLIAVWLISHRPDRG